VDLTREQLLSCMPRCPPDKVDIYLPHLNAAMAEFRISGHSPDCPSAADDESDAVLDDFG